VGRRFGWLGGWDFFLLFFFFFSPTRRSPQTYMPDVLRPCATFKKSNPSANHLQFFPSGFFFSPKSQSSKSFDLVPLPPHRFSPARVEPLALSHQAFALLPLPMFQLLFRNLSLQELFVTEKGLLFNPATPFPKPTTSNAFLSLCAILQVPTPFHLL